MTEVACDAAFSGLDLLEVSLVVHHPHEGAVVLNEDNPICTCGVGFVKVIEDA